MDIEGGMSVEDVSQMLGLGNVRDRKWEIFETSALEGTGLKDVLEWTKVHGKRSQLICEKVFGRDAV